MSGSVVGALRYLNALPLIHGLEDDPAVSEVRYEIPSLLARDLRDDKLAVALVPQVEALRDPSYRIVPGLGVCCRGPVESILLFTTKEWKEIRRVGVDLSSNTSVELLKLLFHMRGDDVPECVEVPPRLDPLRRDAADAAELDAVLLIGDRALAEDHGEFPRFDLGALWTEETGLPFVFAVWLGREGMDPELIGAVESAAERGLGRRRELARSFCREHPEVGGLDAAERYITQVIHYDLGPPEVESMLAFHDLRIRAGLAAEDTASWRPRFFDGEGA